GPDDARRDAGFSTFYMGINLGATVRPLGCGYLGQAIGWPLGFGAAGVGMTLGILQFLLGAGRLGDAGLRVDRRATPGAPAGGLTFSMAEWKRMSAIAVLFFFSAVFWAAFEQAGSSFNLFADRRTRTSLLGWRFPSGWFQSVGPL